MTDRARQFCSDECLAAHNREVGIPRMVGASSKRLSDLRASGADPAHGGEAGAKRGITQRERIDARLAWERHNGSGDALKAKFTREALPKLQNVTLNQMRVATGLSLRYCSLIRSGEREPHAMYIESLAALASAKVASGPDTGRLSAIRPT